MAAPTFAFAITTEQSQTYQDVKTELETVVTIQDIFYANKKYLAKTLAKKFEKGMADCKCLLVFCTADLKSYLDEKKGNSNCVHLTKDEKSTLEKGFKKHKNKIILVNFKGDDDAKIKPKCLGEHELTLCTPKEEMEITKDKMKMKITQSNMNNEN